MIRNALMLALAAIALTGQALLASPAAAQGRFDGWASVIVAGDWRGQGQPIQAFDNARRDLVTGFQAAGFARADMVDYSLRPDVPAPTTADAALRGIAEATSRATRGCFLYFTSHGSPDGIIFGPDAVVSPAAMAQLVRGWCGDRPTVVVVSACYSGVFINALQGPNRVILTAARRDRSSFGCGAEATYPYFDGCVLESLPDSADFLDLAARAKACVSRREAEEHLTPASEPQLYIGANMQMMAPTLRFDRPTG